MMKSINESHQSLTVRATGSLPWRPLYVNCTMPSNIIIGLDSTEPSLPALLKIGPYQGGHGCLVIPFDKGICGAAARTGETQDVPDVHARPEHIACSSSTNSEVVVPVKNSQGEVVAVLDLDSDEHAAFSKDDIVLAERVCSWLGQTYH